VQPSTKPQTTRTVTTTITQPLPIEKLAFDSHSTEENSDNDFKDSPKKLQRSPVGNHGFNDLSNALFSENSRDNNNTRYSQKISELKCRQYYETLEKITSDGEFNQDTFPTIKRPSPDRESEYTPPRKKKSVTPIQEDSTLMEFPSSDNTD